MKTLQIITIVIFALVLGWFFYDAAKTAKSSGGNWKAILWKAVALAIFFLFILVVNWILVHDWAPGNEMLSIQP